MWQWFMPQNDFIGRVSCLNFNLAYLLDRRIPTFLVPRIVLKHLASKTSQTCAVLSGILRCIYSAQKHLGKGPWSCRAPCGKISQTLRGWLHHIRHKSFVRPGTNCKGEGRRTMSNPLRCYTSGQCWKRHCIQWDKLEAHILYRLKWVMRKGISHYWC